PPRAWPRCPRCRRAPRKTRVRDRVWSCRRPIAEPVPRLTEAALCEGEHFARVHAEDERLALVVVAEAAVSDVVAPAPVPLTRPCFGETHEKRRLCHLFG